MAFPGEDPLTLFFNFCKNLPIIFSVISKDFLSCAAGKDVVTTKLSAIAESKIRD